MAVAGGMTTAYVVEVKPMQTTLPSDRCAKPADAVAAVRRGEKATVQGSRYARVLAAAEGDD